MFELYSFYNSWQVKTMQTTSFGVTFISAKICKVPASLKIEIVNFTQISCDVFEQADSDSCDFFGMPQWH